MDTMTDYPAAMTAETAELTLLGGSYQLAQFVRDAETTVNGLPDGHPTRITMLALAAAAKALRAKLDAAVITIIVPAPAQNEVPMPLPTSYDDADPAVRGDDPEYYSDDYDREYEAKAAAHVPGRPFGARFCYGEGDRLVMPDEPMPRYDIRCARYGAFDELLGYSYAYSTNDVTDQDDDRYGDSDITDRWRVAAIQGDHCRCHCHTENEPPF